MTVGKKTKKGKLTPEEEEAGKTPPLQTPFNLENLRKHLAHVRLARRALPEDVVVRQKLLEESVWDVAQARMKQQNDLFKQLGMDNQALKSNMLQAWMWSWHLKLTERLTEEIKTLINSEQLKTHPMRLSSFLSLLKPDTLSLITILEVMRLHGTGGIHDGMKTGRALIQVGKAVEMEYKAEMCRKNNIQLPSSGHSLGLGGGSAKLDFFSKFGYKDLQARRVAARKYMEDSEEWTSTWTQSVRVKVGSILVDALMGVAKLQRTAVDKRTGKEV